VGPEGLEPPAYGL